MRLLGQLQTLYFFLQKDFARTKSIKSTKNTKNTKITKTQPSKGKKTQISE